MSMVDVAHDSTRLVLQCSATVSWSVPCRLRQDPDSSREDLGMAWTDSCKRGNGLHIRLQTRPTTGI